MQLKGGGELDLCTTSQQWALLRVFFLNKNFRDFFGCMHQYSLITLESTA